MQDQSLETLDAVRLALEKATSVQELKHIIDAAKAAEVYARQAKLGKDIQDRAWEYIRRAECRLGEIIAAAKAAGEITHNHGNQWVVDGHDNPKVKLAEIGISRDLSSRAQKLARMPKGEFEQMIAGHKDAQGTKRKRRAPAPHNAAPVVTELADQGLTDKQIAAKTGVGQRQVRHIIEEEAIRRDERAAKAPITAELLGLSQQKRLELAIKQHITKLDREYAAKLHAGVRRYLEIRGEELRKEQAQAKRIMESRQGFMTRATYKKILSCLHPDWVTDPKQKARYEEAFSEFTKLEKFLLSEQESPTRFAPIPKTMAEWEELKRQTTAARKAKRQGQKAGLARA